MLSPSKHEGPSDERPAGRGHPTALYVGVLTAAIIGIGHGAIFVKRPRRTAELC